MKILFLSKYSGSRQYNQPTRQVFMSEGLAGLGHEVLLVSSRSNGGGIPKFCGISKVFHHGRFSERILNGPRIKLGFNMLRVFSWIFYEIMGLISWPHFYRFRPDVIIISSLSLFTFITGCFLKFTLRVPLVVEVRDIYPLTLVELGKFRENSIIIRILAKIERFGYRNADLIISPLERFDEYLESLGFGEIPFLWVPMGYSPFFFQPINSNESDKIIELISRLKSEGKFVYAYAGAFGDVNDLERLFNIAQSCCETKICFIFMGDGPLKQKYESDFGQIKNVHIVHRVPKSDVVKVLMECDVLLHPVKHKDIYNYGVSPNKWIDYALSKRPFITTLQAKLKITKCAGNAFVTADGSDDALRNEIIRVAALPKFELDAVGKRGFDFITSNFAYSVLAVKLADAIESSICGYHSKPLD